MAYKELTEGWSYHEGEEGQTGTRAFADDPSGGVAVLPKVGDKFPAIPNLPTIVGRAKGERLECLCRGFEIQKFGGHRDKNMYTYHYSTKATDSSDITEKYVADLPRNLELAGHDTEINAPGKWKWPDTTDIPFSGDNAVSITKRIITGSMTMEKVTNRLPLDTILSVVGRVNSDDFPKIKGQPSLPAGIWLCAGVGAEEFRNDKGQLRWRLRPTFLFRSVTGDPSDGKGHNYVWRKDTDPPDWDKPLTKTGNNPVYASADFGTLLT